MSYFKVVKYYRDALSNEEYFLSTSCNSNPYKVRYEINEWVKPKLEGSQLFVFNSLINAINFTNNYCNTYDYKVFECEIDSPTPCRYLALEIFYIKDFWLSNELPNYRIKGAPFGTVGCKAVKLTKEVKL